MSLSKDFSASRVPKDWVMSYLEAHRHFERAEFIEDRPYIGYAEVSNMVDWSFPVKNRVSPYAIPFGLPSDLPWFHIVETILAKKLRFSYGACVVLSCFVENLELQKALASMYYCDNRHAHEILYSLRPLFVRLISGICYLSKPETSTVSSVFKFLSPKVERAVESSSVRFHLDRLPPAASIVRRDLWRKNHRRSRVKRNGMKKSPSSPVSDCQIDFSDENSDFLLALDPKFVSRVQHVIDYFGIPIFRDSLLKSLLYVPESVNLPVVFPGSTVFTYLLDILANDMSIAASQEDLVELEKHIVALSCPDFMSFVFFISYTYEPSEGLSFYNDWYFLFSLGFDETVFNRVVEFVFSQPACRSVLPNAESCGECSICDNVVQRLQGCSFLSFEKENSLGRCHTLISFSNAVGCSVPAHVLHELSDCCRSENYHEMVSTLLSSFCPEAEGGALSSISGLVSGIANLGALSKTISDAMCGIKESLTKVTDFVTDWWPEMLAGALFIVSIVIALAVKMPLAARVAIITCASLGAALFAGSTWLDECVIKQISVIANGFGASPLHRRVKRGFGLKFAKENPDIVFGGNASPCEERSACQKTYNAMHSLNFQIAQPSETPSSFARTNRRHNVYDLFSQAAQPEDDPAYIDSLTDLAMDLIDPSDDETEVVDAEAGEFCTSVLNVLSRCLNLKSQLLHMAYLSALSRSIKDVCSLFRWLFELIPVAIQTKIVNCCPDIMSSVLYAQSRWRSFATSIDKCMEDLKEPTSANVDAALVVRKAAKAYVTLHCGEGWANHAEQHLTKFGTAIEIAETKVKTLLYGETPLMVHIAGGPNIGKTMAANALGAFLNGLYSGKPLPSRTYRVPPGEYWENTEGADGAVFPEIYGVSDQTNLQQAEVWMALADGNFKPNAASIEKKDRMLRFSYVLAASNQLYPSNIPSFHNMEALWRRCDLRLACGFNKDFAPQCATTKEKMAYLQTLPSEEQNLFPHLLFAWVYSVPPNPARVSNYNSNLFADMIEATEKARYAAHPDPEIRCDTGKMTYSQLCGVLFDFATEKQRRTKDLTVNQIAAATSIYDRLKIKFVEPVAEMGPANVFDPMTILKSPSTRQEEKNQRLYKLCLSVGVGLPIIGALALAAYGLYRFYNSKKSDAEPEYGARARGIVNHARNARLAHVRTTLEANAEGDVPTVKSPAEVFTDVLIRNVCVARFEGYNLNGFLLTDRLLLLPSHIARTSTGSFKFGSVLEVEVPIGETKINRQVEVTKENSFFFRGVNEDIMVVNLRQPVPGIRKISGFLLTESDLAHLTEGMVVTRSSPGKDASGPLKAAWKNIRYSGFAGITQSKIVLYEAQNAPGACGSPVWGVFKNTLRILGFHTAGLSGSTDGAVRPRSYFTRVTREEFSMICTYFSKDASQNLSQMDLEETIAEGLLPNLFSEPQQARAPVGNFSVLADVVEPPGSNTRTRLKKTPICDAYAECRVAPAVLDPAIIPIMEEKYGVERFPIPQSLMSQCEKTSDLLYPVPQESLRFWTIEEAVQSIPADASVGYGWKVKRKDLMPLVDGIHVVAPQLRESVDRVIQSIDSGKIPLTVIQPCLKDECLKHEKIRDRKTRTFQISRIELLVLGTMAFGDYMDYLHHNPVNTPSTVGCDPASREWDLLFAPLLDWSEDKIFLVDLDYKSMEATITWQLFESYLRHTTRYYRDYGSQAWKIRYAYLLMMCQSGMVFGANLWYRNLGNPSGMKGTTDVNTYAAGIYAMYAFFDNIPGARPQDFVAMVKCRFNGDDTVLAVGPEVRQSYNFFTIRDSLAKLNVVITPAIKDGEPQPNVEQTAVQFCKKQILFSDELQALVPFVSFRTLLDQLSYARDISSDGLVQIINSALQWSFFRGNSKYNGQIPETEPTFDEQRKALLVFVPDRVSEIMTYQVFLDRYLSPREFGTNLRELDGGVLKDGWVIPAALDLFDGEWLATQRTMEHLSLA